MLAMAIVLKGVLITRIGAAEIGRETYQDDGTTLRSEITLAGQRLAVTLSRAPRRAVVEVGGKTITREVPPGTLALENGHWQAYALVVEQYPDVPEPRPVKVLLPATGATLDGKLRVVRRPDRGHHVELAIGAVSVEVDLAPNGAVTHASVPLQGVEVLPGGAARGPPAAAGGAAGRKPPDGVVEEEIEIGAPGAVVRGVLWRPAKVAKPPLAIIIAGSGPTNRDGNGPQGLDTDTYRMLAEALARAGVASIRYDKRGIGASDRVAEADLSIDDFVDDAAALMTWARGQAGARLGKVTLIGHSEGGLVALLLARKRGAAGAPLDGLVLVATAGRPLADVIHEQLATKVSPADLREADAALAALREGKPVKRYPPALSGLFRPSVAKFMHSVLPIDPAALLGALKTPPAVAVVQGETDAQVAVADARRLAAARKEARLSLLPRVNHALKEEATRALPQASYTDPSRPLGPGVVEAIVSGVAR